MIHPSAHVSKLASIGKDVQIGPFTTIHDGVRIGDGCVIEGYCEIGCPTKLSKNQELIIGANSTIRSHSVIYTGSHFGPGLKTGHHITVREDIIAGPGLLLGTNAELMGGIEIGDYVKIYNNAQIARHTKIGNYVWIYLMVSITNDPTPPCEELVGAVIEDYAVIASKATILPGIKIGQHALVAAQSCVTKDVPAYALVAGVPAKQICLVTDVKLKDGSGKSAYPWVTRFQRDYPAEVVEQWMQEFGEV